MDSQPAAVLFSDAQLAAIQDTVRSSLDQALQSLPFRSWSFGNSPQDNVNALQPRRPGSATPFGLHRPLEQSLQDKILRAPTTVRVPAPTPNRPASRPRLGLGQSASGLTDHQAVTQVPAPFHTSAAVADPRTIPSSPAPAVFPKSNDAILGPVAVPATAVKDKVQLLARNFSQGLFVSCNRKNSLYKQFQTNPTESNKSRYNKYRNKYNFLIRVARKKYFHDKLVSVSSDLRKTWSVIKQIISKKKSEQHFSNMKDSTGVCSDPSRIATKFNNFLLT